MPVTIRVVVPPELRRALDGNMQRVVQRASPGIIRELHATVAKYPPATAANQPNHRWYERGYGPRWTRKDGSIGGSKTSEMLNRSWGTQRKSWGMILGSRASYAPVVHSHEEQAKFHGARGWVTDKQAADKVIQSGKVDRIVKAAVARVLKGMG